MRTGIAIFFFDKVSFLKHPNVHFLRHISVLDMFRQQLWMYICIGYILPTIMVCCSVGECKFVLDIFCQQLWGVVQLGGCLCALRAQGWVMYIFLDMCLYWIYFSNNCGVLFTWGDISPPRKTASQERELMS